MDLKIRPYTEADYQYTHDLQKENVISYIDKYWGGWNSDIFRRDVCPDITWIIECDGQMAGFFVLSLKEKAHLRNIEIAAAFRNKGLGSQVMDHCERESVKKGFNELYLEVFLDNPARSLYERLGYKTYRVSETHYMMKKQLKKPVTNS